jgi:hypothetical protein
MLSPENKKLERLQKVLDHGGETKDVVMFDLLIEELSQYFNTSTDAITEAIQKLQEREEKETVVNVEAPVVNVPAPVVNVEAPVVNVEAPIVNVDTKEVSEGVQQILKQLQEQIPFTIEEYVKDGRIKVEVDRVGTGGGGVISFPIVDALNNGRKTRVQLAVQIDDVSTASVTYVGKATIGSAISSAVWQIAKIDESGSPITFTKKYAGSGNFTQIWSNRTSLTYT